MFHQIMCLFMILLLFVSCGGSESSIKTGGPTPGTNYDNGISDLVSTVEESVNSASGLLDTGSMLMYRGTQEAPVIRKILGINDSFGSLWTTASGSGIYDPTANSPTQISAKDYLGIILDETAVNGNGSGVNPFTRMNNDLMIFCAIGVGMAAQGETISSEGYVDAGTYSFTFTPSLKSSMTSTCGIDTSVIPDNQVVNITVTASSGTTFERKFSFDIFNQDYWVTNNSSVLRIASGEDASQGRSRSYIEINKNTNVLRAQYVWISDYSLNGGIELYRIYFDETNDEAMVAGYSGTGGASGTDDSGTRYILAGRPQTGSDISVSLRKSGVIPQASYEACVDSLTGNILVDGSRCVGDGDSLNGLDVGNFQTRISTFYSNYNSGSWTQWNKANLNQMFIFPFTTMADIVSLNFSAL